MSGVKPNPASLWQLHVQYRVYGGVVCSLTVQLLRCASRLTRYHTGEKKRESLPTSSLLNRLHVIKFKHNLTAHSVVGSHGIGLMANILAFNHKLNKLDQTTIYCFLLKPSMIASQIYPGTGNSAESQNV